MLLQSGKQVLMLHSALRLGGVCQVVEEEAPYGGLLQLGEELTMMTSEGSLLVFCPICPTK